MKPKAARPSEVLEAMRGGATITIGGSRCNTTYGFRDGAWYADHFDEGYGESSGYDEARIRDLIARHPNEAREIVRRRRWLPFSEAFLAGDPEAALEHLADARQYGDPFDYGRILEAFIRCRVDEQTRALILDTFSGYTMYHCFMEAARWRTQEREVGRKGVLFVDRLIELVGPCPGCYKVRASFQEMAGDLAAALADVECELAQTPSEPAFTRQYIEGLASRFREKLQGQA